MLACDRRTIVSAPDAAPDAPLPVRSACLDSRIDTLARLGEECSIEAARRIAALEPDARAIALLDAARAEPGFHEECDVPDSLAARPIAEHPNVDACTRHAAFEPDPWGTDVRVFCSIDIGTFLFLDRIATRLGGNLPELRTGIMRKMTCDANHPNVIERKKRIREAADAWNERKGLARKEHREQYTW